MSKHNNVEAFDSMMSFPLNSKSTAAEYAKYLNDLNAAGAMLSIGQCADIATRANKTKA